MPAWHITISLDSCSGVRTLLKGKKSGPVDYRPVSPTTIPCNIMEHCMVSSIWSHLNKNNIMTSKQHGFRTDMSCDTQLKEATDDWTNTLSKGKGQIDVILHEFSNDFNVVPHHRLLMKLCMYGIAGKTHRWIKDFLGNRLQEVVVNGSKSECRMVKSGLTEFTPIHIITIISNNYYYYYYYYFLLLSILMLSFNGFHLI